MGAYVARHNSKVLKHSQGGQSHPPPSCNCQKSKRQDCPLPGACNQNGVVYQATVTNTRGDIETYVGLAKNFKTDIQNIRQALKNKHQKTQLHFQLTIEVKKMQAGDLALSGIS